MFLTRFQSNQLSASAPYATHQMVWGWFSDSCDRERDFLYRQEVSSSKRTIIALSSRLPVCSGSAWQYESKEFLPQLGQGARLHFTLHANPTRWRRNAAGRKSRHDVVMDLKFQARQADNNVSIEKLRHQACGDWLALQGKRAGFVVDMTTFVVESYRQVEFSKSPRKSGGIRLAVADMRGVLDVVDPVEFVASLSKGFGTAKSFGCGLMLVRRV